MLLIFCTWKKKKIYPPFFSKHNSNQIWQIFIPNEKRRHYLAVKKPKKKTALQRGITSRKKEFNQYQKSDKALFIIYADLQCNIFHQAFQGIQYHNLKVQKISMMDTEVKIVWKSIVNL